MWQKIVVEMFILLSILAKLVRTCSVFIVFIGLAGLVKPSHLSMFSHAAKWSREQGFSVFHAQL